RNRRQAQTPVRLRGRETPIVRKCRSPDDLKPPFQAQCARSLSARHVRVRVRVQARPQRHLDEKRAAFRILQWLARYGWLGQVSLLEPAPRPVLAERDAPPRPRT